MIRVSTVSVAGTHFSVGLRAPLRVTRVSEIHSNTYFLLEPSHVKKAAKCIQQHSQISKWKNAYNVSQFESPFLI